MKVSAKKQLLKVLNDKKALSKKFGELAKPLMIRLSTLRAAPTLAHVPTAKPERLHQLSQDRDEQFAVDIKGQSRLIFVPDHDPIPRNADGGINKNEVTAICITEVNTQHYK